MGQSRVQASSGGALEVGDFCSMHMQQALLCRAVRIAKRKWTVAKPSQMYGMQSQGLKTYGVCLLALRFILDAQNHRRLKGRVRRSIRSIKTGLYSSASAVYISVHRKCSWSVPEC